ncbi:hypothetical protein [Altererythrobacter sp. Root672]|uniref:PAS domain-containing protein n=1 Tax=Altererythrobacter sp. Root672 TaxID=1736584 RepID=UPI0006F5ED29|nr:hypothetical protein [Altererythrobacter sp. Root672]KRA81611.1 hypothetical protein ASD76_13890 [Altererythrobacter sp. Root672]
MDTVRGNFGPIADGDGYDPADDEPVRRTPPRPEIGQDERRMQVRAYNHWASLLDDRNYPAIEDLELDSLPDFGPYSVLLDFSRGIENPGISFIGDKLAEECGEGDAELLTLADVPARSLLTRITDHYMQILANQAPIGFEAEFVNQRGATLAYRGILLPYSSDDDTIDFIYGVINWKELADSLDSDELLLEIDQVLEARTDTDFEDHVEDLGLPTGLSINVTYSEPPAPTDDVPTPTGFDPLPLPSFGIAAEEEAYALADDDEAEDEELFEAVYQLDESEEEDDEEVGYESDDSDEAEEDDHRPSFGSLLKMPILTSEGTGKLPIELGDPIDDDEFDLTDYIETAMEMPSVDPMSMGLSDWLAAAREMADAANNSEDRTRTALYEAIGRAYDFSLAAIETPNEFNELLADAGLTVQVRAPMTPVVKLVFGHDYDKTRLTEYASALTYAHRIELPRGALGPYLRDADGGLKGVVQAERRLRREEAGKDVETPNGLREALALKLRGMPSLSFNSLAPEGNEFALVMIRRNEAGEIVILGEVPEDASLLERAAKRLIG